MLLGLAWWQELLSVWSCLGHVWSWVFSCVALPCFCLLLLLCRTRENSILPGRETKVGIKNDKNMCKHRTKHHRFWGRFGTHCEVFEIGPLQTTYMPDPLLLTCWNLCVFCGGHGRFLRIWGVLKKLKNGNFLSLFLEPPFFVFWEEASPKWSRNGFPFSHRGPSSSIVNSGKISLFVPLDGGPFVGPRPRPLKIRRGSIFWRFVGSQQMWNGGLFFVLFLDN